MIVVRKNIIIQRNIIMAHFSLGRKVNDKKMVNHKKRPRSKWALNFVMDTRTMPLFGHEDLPNIRQGTASTSNALSEMLTINTVTNLYNNKEKYSFSVTTYVKDNIARGDFYITPISNTQKRYTGGLTHVFASALYNAAVNNKPPETTITDNCFMRDLSSTTEIRCIFTLSGNTFTLVGG